MSNFIENIDSSWCLFLDRDGVINKRIFGGYVSKWSDFEFQAGVCEAIAVFAKVFKYIFVITNQQGIGKGIMTKEQVADIHKDMKAEIETKGGRITNIYFCPDLASKENNCRKPSPFLAEKAKNDFPKINFGKSIMIGDSNSDILFGQNAGMFTVLHFSKEKVEADADLKVNSLLDFAEMIKEKQA